mgnify:CR=1 FL=1
MNSSLWVAKTGLDAQQTRMQVVSNNLANANTVGFQSDFEMARGYENTQAVGFKTRVNSVTEHPATDFNRGVLIETGRELDMAVKGDGWIAVQAKDGTEGFSRAGQLHISPEGQLMTGNNLPVLGNGGPIAIPEADRILIGGDGTITIQPRGQGAEQLSVIDRIKLVSPAYQDLYKADDGLVRRRDGQEQQPDAALAVQSGFLESSNVSAVDELVNIMSLSRQYELNVTMMKTMDDNASAASTVLRDS